MAFALGAAVLTIPEQTRDLVAELADNSRANAAFAMGTFMWSFALWFWARWAITLQCGDGPVPLGFLGGLFRLPFGEQLPRFLALSGSLAATYATWRGAGQGLPTLLAFGGGALVYVVGWYRRPLAAWLRPRWFVGAAGRVLDGDRGWIAQSITLREAVGLPPQGGIPALDARRPRGQTLWDNYYAQRALGGRFGHDLAAAPFGGWFAALLLIGAILFAGLAWGFPQWLAGAFGAAGTAMLSLAALTTIASVAVLWADRHFGLPPIRTLLITGFLLSYTAANNHDIRLLPASKDIKRVTMRDAARAWLKTCAPEDGPVPVVLVATAGGASRAALWTGTVLGDLEDADPQFPRRVFGVSGVSGGSLGAALWVALLAEDGVTCRNPETAARTKRVRADAFNRFMNNDYLAAMMAGALLTDPLWWSFPLNWFVRLVPSVWNGEVWTPPDRAVALEHAWEDGWRRAMAHPDGSMASDRFAGSLHALWQTDDEKWSWTRPLLFLNGTHQQTGLPVVTAPVTLSPPDFQASHDLLQVVGRDIRLSTAVTNSARFPYLTPTGGIRATNGRGTGYGNLADGGYFDNQGGATLSDVAVALQEAFLASEVERKKDDPTKPTRELRLMVVQISSDPDRRPDELVRCGDIRPAADGVTTTPEKDAANERERAIKALGGGGQSPSGLDAPLGPLMTVTATQSAHTVRSSVNLARVFCANAAAVRPKEGVTTDFVHFILGRESADPGLPLNWVLPEPASRYIKTLAITSKGNREELKRFADWVNGGPRSGGPGTPSAAPAAPPMDVAQVSERLGTLERFVRSAAQRPVYLPPIAPADCTRVQQTLAASRARARGGRFVDGQCGPLTNAAALDWQIRQGRSLAPAETVDDTLRLMQDRALAASGGK